MCLLVCAACYPVLMLALLSTHPLSSLTGTLVAVLPATLGAPVVCFFVAAGLVYSRDAARTTQHNYRAVIWLIGGLTWWTLMISFFGGMLSIDNPDFLFPEAVSLPFYAATALMAYAAILASVFLVKAIDAQPRHRRLPAAPA